MTTTEVNPTLCSSDPCESVLAGEEPDMRLGDTCLLCCCRECERCGRVIDLDDENQVVSLNSDDPGTSYGYIDVCDGCLQDSAILYAPEQEADRRLEMA